MSEAWEDRLPVLDACSMPPPRIALVGEAPGKEEEKQGLPFIGASGKELNRMLRDAGLLEGEDMKALFSNRALHFHTDNVFPSRPPKNDIKAFTLPVREAEKKWRLMQGDLVTKPDREIMRWPLYPWPDNWSDFPRLQRRAVDPAQAHHLPALEDRLCDYGPDMILALGATPLWALTGQSGIGDCRGYLFHPPRLPCPVLPTYHPAAVLRAWNLRPIALSDLMKANDTLEGKAETIQREIIIRPKIHQVSIFIGQMMNAPPPYASIDVETHNGQITRLGIAPSKDRALVVPFVDIDAEDIVNRYWTEHDEIIAWNCVRAFMESPIHKVGQNGLYDLQYIFGKHGIRVINYSDDTMLQHHALQPEMLKGLGFLASLYTHLPRWKFLRGSKPDTEKRDD